MGIDTSKLLSSVVILATVVLSEQAVFECHGDVCNFNKKHQFCSETFRYCRDCEKIEDDCGTAKQPLNCTGFCLEMAVAEALKEDAERKKKFYERTCWVEPMMLSIANGVATPKYNDSRVPVGSKLVYSCNSGYSLEGPDTITCLGNSTWNQTVMPYCLDKAWLGYKTATIALIIGNSITCAFLFAFLLMTYKYLKAVRSCKESKMKGGISGASTVTSLPDEEQRLIGDQNAHSERETPSDQTGTSEPDQPNEYTAGNTPAYATPTAPSAEFIDENKPRNTENKSNRFSQDSTIHQIVVQTHITNQQIIHNAPKPQEPHENSEEKVKEGNGPDNGNRKKYSSIDEKKPTEESKEINTGTVTETSEAVEETAEEKEGKGRGTKPLPARDEDSKSEVITELTEDTEARGPRLATEKEESIRATVETGPGQTTGKIGFQSVTFSKSDIKPQKNKGPSTKVNTSTEEVNSLQKMVKMKEDRGAETV